MPPMLSQVLEVKTIVDLTPLCLRCVLCVRAVLCVLCVLCVLSVLRAGCACLLCVLCVRVPAMHWRNPAFETRSKGYGLNHDNPKTNSKTCVYYSVVTRFFPELRLIYWEETAPKRSSTKENVQIGFGNTFDCVITSVYLATSEPCLATSNRSFKTRWLHLFLSSKYVRGQKRVSFDHLGLKPSLGAV